MFAAVTWQILRPWPAIATAHHRYQPVVWGVSDQRLSRWGLKGVELDGPRLVSSAEQLFGGYSAGGATDGITTHVQFPGDLANSVALG
jgi:hypothetical protein